MIDIILGSCNDDVRVINKTFNQRITKSCEINYPCEELKPSLIFSRDVLAKSDNYAFIPYFNKYYFLSPPIYEGKKVIVNCTVDLLYTYAAELQEIPCTVIRTEKGATDIIDNTYPINTNNYFINAQYFPNNPFERTSTDDNKILLSVITSKNKYVEME
jgi:hypothetical protein